MKCATSTVCAYLEDHPDVYMVPNCDPNFFSDNEKYSKGIGWYSELFRSFDGQKACGEGSNNYTAGEMFPDTAERIAKYNSNIKLIYMVRHPVDRIVSAWLQNRSDSGDEVPANLDQAIIDRHERFIDQSLYWKNISRYRLHFDEEQIFVGFMEDLRENSTSFFQRLTSFLEVDFVASIEKSHQNPSQGKKIPSKTYTLVNQMPFSGALKKVFPARLKQYAKQHLFSTMVTKRPELSPGLRKWVLNEVKEDSLKFLEHYQKPMDFWNLEN